MPFVPDPIGERIYDSVRGMELVESDGNGGSSGYRSYSVQGGGGGFQFWAKMATRDQAPPPDADGTEHIMWLIYSNGVLRDADRAEMRRVITDAMIAHRTLFGLPESGPRYSVHFE